LSFSIIDSGEANIFIDDEEFSEFIFGELSIVVVKDEWEEFTINILTSINFSGYAEIIGGLFD